MDRGRPRVGETEEELLAAQRAFLESGARPGAEVVTPGRSNAGAKAESGAAAAAATSDRIERDVTTVLTGITERTPASQAPTVPKPRPAAFEHARRGGPLPKRPPAGGKQPSGGRKKSLFAQRFDAAAAAGSPTATAATATPSPTTTSRLNPQPTPSNDGHRDAGTASRVPTGQEHGNGGARAASTAAAGPPKPADPDSISEQTRQQNAERVQRMSAAEIEQAHDELKRLFSPESLRFLHKRAAGSKGGGGGDPAPSNGGSMPRADATDASAGGGGDSSAQSAASAGRPPPTVTASAIRGATSSGLAPSQSTTAPTRHLAARMDSTVQPSARTQALPIATELAANASQKGWVNMGKVEQEKLQWTSDVTEAELEEAAARNPIRKTEVRFDLAGRVVPPDAQIEVTAGLHHHADFPEQAGYTLGEIVRLIRSQYQPQRLLALEVVANIVRRCWTGENDSTTGTLSGLPGEETESDNLMECMLSMGVPLFLRGALDDDAPAVVAIAVAAVEALLTVPPAEEASLDARELHPFGHRLPPLRPLDDPEEDQEELKEDPSGLGADAGQVEDIERCRRDLVAGMLAMDLLPRLSVLLAHQPGVYDSETHARMLRVLIRVARHSLSSATAVADTRGLIPAVFHLFLNPATALVGGSPAKSRNDGDGGSPDSDRTDGESSRTDDAQLCTLLALKLVRVLAGAGRSVGLKVTEHGRMGSVVAFAVDGLGAFQPAARGLVKAEAYGVLRCCIAHGTQHAAFVSLCQPLIQRGAELARQSPAAHALGQASETVQLIRLFEVALQSTHADAVAAEAEGGAGAGGEAETGAGHSGRVGWQQVEHLLVPVLEMIQGAATLAHDTVGTSAQPTPSSQSGTPEQATAASAHSTVTSASTLGAINVLSAGLRFVGTYVEVHRKLLPEAVVAVLDSTAAAVGEVLGHAGAEEVRDWAWKLAAEVPDKLRTHGTARTLYRFIRHPCVFLGSGGPVNEARAAALGYLASTLWVCLKAAKVNQGLLGVVTAVVDGERMAQYVQAAGKLPRLVDRDDTIPYRLQLEHALQLLMLRWAHTAGMGTATDATTQLACRLVTQLPPGYETEVLWLLDTVIFPGRGQGSPQSADARGDLGAARTEVLARAISGPCASARDQTTVLDLPATRSRTVGLLQQRSSSLDALPLEPGWLWQPVLDACGRIEAAGGANEAALARLAAALNTVMVVESSLPELTAALSGGERIAALLEVVALGEEVVFSAPVEAGVRAVLGQCADPDPRWPARWTHGGVRRVIKVFQQAVEDFTVTFADKASLTGRVLVLPLQQQCPVDLRLDAFRNDRFLQLCEVPIEWARPFLRRYLEPAEQSAELIELYLVALFGRRLDPESNSLLYWVAVHHLSAHIFAPAPPADSEPDAMTAGLNRKHTAAMVEQLIAVAPDTVYRDVVFHDPANLVASGTVVRLDALAADRRAVLEAAAAAKPELQPLLWKRHPHLAQ